MEIKDKKEAWKEKTKTEKTNDGYMNSDTGFVSSLQSVSLCFSENK